MGLALGAPLVAWLIEVATWRWSFIITGAVGFIWVAVWLSLVSTPERTRWLPEPERQRILAERDAGVEPPSHGGVGYLGLIRCPTMWGLFVSQGCLVYSVYLYMTWLPNYPADGSWPLAGRVRLLHVNSLFRCFHRQYCRQLVRRQSPVGAGGAQRQATLSSGAVPVTDGRRRCHTACPIADCRGDSGLDRSIVRKCRPGG